MVKPQQRKSHHNMETRGRRARQGGPRQFAFASDASDFDTRKLQTQLARKSLYIKDISGDGNCLFRALADQLGEEIDKDRHRQIRYDVVQYLRDRPDEFSFFVEEDYDGYLDRMGKDGVYGDNLEIVAFARRYVKYVKIYQPDLVYVVTPAGEDQCDTASEVSDAEMLHIAYHSWEHYSSVRNLEGPHSGPPLIKPEARDIPDEAEAKSGSSRGGASGMEKQLIASVPGLSIEQAKEALRKFGGNINRAVDHLLEERELQEQLAAIAGDDACPSSPDEVSKPATDADESAKSEDHGEAPSHKDGEQREATSPEVTSSPKRKAGTNKRVPARQRKEDAKRAQKAATLVRKRQNKALAGGLHLDKTAKLNGGSSPSEGIASDVRTLRI
ncbi:hypothetical protein PYCC9005_000214 [Savitreella phatthalungensis]